MTSKPRLAAADSPATCFPGEAPVPGGSLRPDVISAVIGEPATADAGVVKVTLGRDAAMHPSNFGKPAIELAHGFRAVLDAPSEVARGGQ